MCHSATGLIIQLQCPLKGIEILRSAIKRIQTSNSQLTSAHADLIQLCLLAKCFKPALEFLDVDIMSISQEVRPLLSQFYNAKCKYNLKNCSVFFIFYRIAKLIHGTFSYIFTMEDLFMLP